MPYCRNCGAVVGANELACRSCGAVQQAQAVAPPPPVYYYPPPQQDIHVTQHGPWTAIGWIVLVVIILVVVGVFASVICLGYSCAQITIAVPLGLYIWKRWMVRRAGLG